MGEIVGDGLKGCKEGFAEGAGCAKAFTVTFSVGSKAVGAGLGILTMAINNRPIIFQTCIQVKDTNPICQLQREINTVSSFLSNSIHNPYLLLNFDIIILPQTILNLVRNNTVTNLFKPSA